MNPEILPRTPAVEAIAPQESPGLHEGFYTPEHERQAVPRTVAAHNLTRLVSLLLPNTTNTVDINSRHVVDGIDSEFQEHANPKTNTVNREIFTKAISPLLDKLGKIGCGDYIANRYLTKIEHYTLSPADEVVFNSLYIPWEYNRNGTINPFVNIAKLSAAIKKLPENTDQQISEKTEALECLHTLTQIHDTEKLALAQTLSERLDQPNVEHLTIIRDDLNLINEVTISRVASINEADKAEHDADREMMKRISLPILYLIKSLHNNTRILVDHDKSMYPEFWQLVDKVHRINCAIGIFRPKENTVRHDLNYPI